MILNSSIMDKGLSAGPVLAYYRRATHQMAAQIGAFPAKQTAALNWAPYTSSFEFSIYFQSYT